jgi:hypothetical protein
VSSILTSVKKTLGLDASYTDFDADILLYINSVFATLNQLGIGPEQGFAIEDATPTWDAFLGNDLRLNNVKAYVYLKVRMLFDPPQTSFLIEALNKQALELEVRINTYRESYAWTDPSGDLPADMVLDGGDA